MRRLRFALSLLAVAALAFTVAGTADARVEPLRPVRTAEFSVSVPARWKTVVDVGAMKLISVARTRDSGVFTNANVIEGAARRGVPLERWRAQVVAELAAAPMVHGVPRARVVHIGGVPAIELEYTGSLGGAELHWLAYAFDTGTHGYVLTFTAAESAYGRYAPTFARIARSFRVR